MISFFRRFFASKVGLPLVLAFLALIAVAFAASDLSSTNFTGISGGDKLAVVGNRDIPLSEVSVAANTELRGIRQQNPTLTMPEFVAQGGLDEVMRQLIDRYAVGAYGTKYGLRAGENLVNSEFLKIPAFKGLTGPFDRQISLAALQRQGLTDAIFRRDLADGLIEQQLLRPAVGAPRMPMKVAAQYSALVLEKRRGEIALIPSLAYAPVADPTEAQLTKWYQDNRTRFIRPERRTLRFAVFGGDNLKVNAAPTAAEIAARYKRDAATYAARETRVVTSFVVPTQDAAKALAARIRGGASLESVAREAGFTASRAEARDREAMAGATSFAHAEAVFKTAQGGIAEPAQGQLGWYVARVDGINRIAARTLAQATPEITEALTKEMRAAAVADLVAKIEADVDSGTAFAEVAKAYGLTIETTPPLLGDGRVYGNPKAQIVPQLIPVLRTAFQMEESEPQLAPAPGDLFVIYEVARIEEAAAPPLAEVRGDAVIAWKQAQGDILAKAAAERVTAKVRKGTPLGQALAEENKPGIQRQTIDKERREVLADRSGRLPAEMVLLFSMARGTTKTLEAPRDAGWFVVALEDISILPLDKEGQVIAQTSQQLGAALADEYREQAITAMRKELGVTRNDAAIAAVRKQLVGSQ